ncbi:MAG: protein kinase [Myxococcales bacterium]|nr:protein kinase [Myxococcales bacterium]
MAEPGDILAGRWRLIEAIDAGAMGVIYRGEHALLRHPVAIKVLLPEIARDPKAIDRFLREAQIAAKLRHRNVVRVEDFGLESAAGPDARPSPFLVMELLEGMSLARRLTLAERLTARQVSAIVRQIGAALDVAHAAGIVHRDLKPENIFLADDRDAPGAEPVVKVLDFGVAKFTDVLAAGGGATASNTLVGTPRYMSPEQARAARSLDGRSDLWSLGMLTYEMLVGRHPFEGEAIAELLVAILTHKITPPSALRPELPVDLDDFFEQCLARQKHERFATGKVLSEALDVALAACPQDGWPQHTGPGEERRAGTVRVARARVATPKIPPPSPQAEAADKTPLPVNITASGTRTAPPRQTRRSKPSFPEVEADLAAIAALAAAPVAPVSPEVPTPSRGVPQNEDTLPTAVASSKPSTPPPAGAAGPRFRTGTSMAAVAAVLVGALLIGLGLRRPVAPADTVPTRTPQGMAVQGNAEGPSVASARPEVQAPLPPPQAAPEPVSEPAAALTPDAGLRPLRHRHGSRTHRRHLSREGATPQGSSLYDPPGI